MTGLLTLSSAVPSLVVPARADLASARLTGNVNMAAPAIVTFHTVDYVTRNGWIGELSGRISVVAEAAGYPLRLESPTSIIQRVAGVDQLTLTASSLTSTVPLVLPGTPVVDLATSGPLTIGPTTGLNLTFDREQIQARNNGAIGNLHLQDFGGEIKVGQSLTTNGVYTTNTLQWWWTRGPKIVMYPAVLQDASAEIGWQNGHTFYQRLPRTTVGQFAWYAGGVYSDTALDPGVGPGAGNSLLMDLRHTGKLTLNTPTTTNGIDLTTTAHPFQIGPDTANHLAFDTGSIQARVAVATGNAASLVLQPRRGQVDIGSTTSDFSSLQLKNCPLYFYNGATNVANISAVGTTELRLNTVGQVIFHKTASGIANDGNELLASGSIWNTMATDAPNLILNKQTGAIVATAIFQSFRLTNSQIGRIERNASTSAVLYQVSSDYRLKNVLGPVEGALDKVMALRPRWITWKGDPTEMEMAAFIAHEVDEVVPWAVSGEKDAVFTADDEENGFGTEGEINPQGLDMSQLIPVLTAAVQELTQRVGALESA